MKTKVTIVRLSLFIFVALLMANITAFAAFEPTFLEWITRCTVDAKNTVCNLVETAESLPLQLLFVFLLGLLMSLTPCIYPMIPITVGVLHANAGKSFTSHFLLSLSYTLGMALTFAIFGFIAALSGNIFSQLLVHPVFVIVLVAFLAYLAFSMFGFYEMRMPRFLSRHQTTSQGGSPLSAFLFGAASGTIASPCLSPGLALLLSMVATMGNKLLGFGMLFLFGIGTSLPLLLVGTFSGTLTFLPRAGTWMLEIKKIFGFMLLAMCFYYLNNILPSYFTLLLMAIGAFIAGVYYFSNISPMDSPLLKKIKNIFGLLFIVMSFLIGWQSFKTWISPQSLDQSHIFSSDYTQAELQARSEGKKLFIDFGATYCTTCKFLEKKFASPIVQQELDRFITVYVDGSYATAEPFASLKQKYGITGFPTVIIIDPQSSTLEKKWSGEIINLSPEQIVQLLRNY